MRNIAFNCLAGPLKGQAFHLDGGPVFLFGRHAKATFSLACDPAASHLHFLVDTSENRIRIFDLGSTNGLVINDKHLGGKQGAPFTDFVALKDGDTVLAGACLFKLSVVEETPSTRVARLTNQQESPISAGQIIPAGGRLTAIVVKGNPQACQAPASESGAPTIEMGEGEPGQPVLPEVSGYTIIERIGGGGKGVVFRAVKNDSGVSAAIKTLPFNRNKNKKKRSLEMFRREINITRQLEHPNIIRYLGDGLSQGMPYLALEYVEGGTLDELIRRSPERRLDLPTTVPLFIQILEAVAHMHNHFLVHRDIKPKNVLLDLRRGGGMAAKLSDMGLSCRFSNNDSDEFLPIVSEGGTPAYMPPEQLTDLTRAIPQSDVFSSGATLYQMLTGSLLYDFTDRDQHDTIIEGNITPILALRPDLPIQVANVVTKSLSYRPEHRYANAQEMLDAFKSALA